MFFHFILFYFILFFRFFLLYFFFLFFHILFLNTFSKSFFLFFYFKFLIFFSRIFLKCFFFFFFHKFVTCIFKTAPLKNAILEIHFQIWSLKKIHLLKNTLIIASSKDMFFQNCCLKRIHVQSFSLK